jgi:DNA modification methylase
MKVKMNKFYKMDAVDFMQHIPDESVDAVITDPPYGVDYADSLYFDDSLSNALLTLDRAIVEMHRVLKTRHYLYMDVPTKYIDLFIEIIRKYFEYVTILTARTKASCMIPKGTYKNDAQFIVVASKGKAKRLNRVDIQRKSDAWLSDKRNTDPNPFSYHYSTILSKRANAEVKNHPNAKNVELIKDFILLSTNIGELVLDPFAGGGSVAKAAVATGRNYYTCDISDEFFIDPCCGSAGWLSSIAKSLGDDGGEDKAA